MPLLLIQTHRKLSLQRSVPYLCSNILAAMAFNLLLNREASKNTTHSRNGSALKVAHAGMYVAFWASPLNTSLAVALVLHINTDIDSPSFTRRIQYLLIFILDSSESKLSRVSHN
jgi:hypothetical protein